ncbi:hypothetical protein BZA05DRAFT_182235 [Tricharina praecox]|uniref:uncharacterized protein n=1 Tax=Tricharina praecox TaxID=43433 RepID=UPI00221FD472|nr:uncharacterized protein BZA05DRAFT_182235 [Tricharina praecox]KAI5843605.1 hypothetical protein BZA05DRAFT_182235 [Tricharina praecox]
MTSSYRLYTTFALRPNSRQCGAGSTTCNPTTVAVGQAHGRRVSEYSGEEGWVTKMMASRDFRQLTRPESARLTTPWSTQNSSTAVRTAGPTVTKRFLLHPATESHWNIRLILVIVPNQLFKRRVHRHLSVLLKGSLLSTASIGPTYVSRTDRRHTRSIRPASVVQTGETRACPDTPHDEWFRLSAFAAATYVRIHREHTNPLLRRNHTHSVLHSFRILDLTATTQLCTEPVSCSSRPSALTRR